jgi:hypothetical protein
MFTAAIAPLESYSLPVMSDFQRVGICTVLFALLLCVGSAIGVVFFLNVPWQSSKLDPVPTHHLRSDKADFVLEIKRELGLDGEKRSKENADITGRANDATADVPDRTLTALPNPPQNLSEPLRPGGTVKATEQPDTIKMPGPDRPDIEQPSSVPSDPAGPETSKEPKPSRRPSLLCGNDACRRAIAECKQLCDAAMSMAVASCPRVSTGASAQEEKTCLAKRDRSRSNCYSGCALRNSQAVKVR